LIPYHGTDAIKPFVRFWTEGETDDHADRTASSGRQARCAPRLPVQTLHLQELRMLNR
jgi:hypothetical protein